MRDESSEKIFEATPHKRRESRKRGQVARSSELNSILVLFAVTIFLAITGKDMFANVELIVKKAFASISTQTDFAQISIILLSLLSEMMLILAPIMIVAFVVAILANVVQFGVLFSAYPLKPQWSRLNPIEGLKRIFSKRGLFELGKALFKLIIIATVGYLTIKGEYYKLPKIMNASGIGDSHNLLIRFVGSAAYKLFFRASLALLIIALIDYFYQRWQFEQDIRMTREEMREERKRTEGDPMIRSRIRRIQRERSQQRMLEEVPEAHTVITNPTDFAVALKYDYETMEAPHIVAKGARKFAKRIKEVAIENQVPIVEDRPLAQALYKNGEVGEEIPVNLYHAVAETLAYINQLTNQYKNVAA